MAQAGRCPSSAKARGRERSWRAGGPGSGADSAARASGLLGCLLDQGCWCGAPHSDQGIGGILEAPTTAGRVLPWASPTPSSGTWKSRTLTPPARPASVLSPPPAGAPRARRGARGRRDLPVCGAPAWLRPGASARRWGRAALSWSRAGPPARSPLPHHPPPPLGRGRPASVRRQRPALPRRATLGSPRRRSDRGTALSLGPGWFPCSSGPAETRGSAVAWTDCWAPSEIRRRKSRSTTSAPHPTLPW